MKKLFSVIFIVLFLPFDLVAQQAFTVSGTIQDENKIALPFSMVYIESLKVSTTTDKEGRYQLMSVPIGKYELSARMIGYQSQSQSLTVTQNLVVDFTLSEESKGLEEVVITGRNQAVELFRSAQAVTVVETQAARLQTADLGEVIAQVQGVNVRRSGGLGSNTRFSLNGLTDHQVRFFLDGIPLDFMGYSFGIANVPVNLVDRVEIYKGVVPVRFGADALGGAVNLVSPKSFFNTSGAASYQVGSFGTHRATIDMQHQSSSSGFFIQSSAFLDAARNNYDIDVEVPDERGRLSEITVPRFHDDYLAWGVNAEAGWRDLKWAAQLSLSFFANQYTRDIQHNNVMTIPYGEVNSKVANYGGLLRWQNEWKSRLSLEVTSGYSYRQTSFQDTSIYFYNWFGERLRDDDGSLRIRPSGGEITFLPSDRRVWDDNYYARLLMKYSLNDNHQIRFSLAPTLVARTGDELRQVDPNAFDPLTSQRDVLTIISGVEYGWNSSDEKLENITFAKSYFQSLRAEEPIPGTVDGIQNRDRQSHDFGFGNSLRFHLNDQWILKASYEWATRLPRPREIFGDAVLIFDNLSLEPERSHNANLELNYQQSTPAHSDWSAGITGFLRQADNLIVLLGNDEVFQYQNVFTATSQGVEAVVGWTSTNDRLSLKTNATYQDFRNASDKGPFGFFDGDRIPNRPYLFANGAARYVWPTPFYKHDQISFFASTRYVHQFFRSWESAGRRDTKQVIPSQFVQNAGFTYKFPLGNFLTACTGEVQNISNVQIFDFFGVQRPGRSFFFKITTQL